MEKDGADGFIQFDSIDDADDIGESVEELAGETAEDITAELAGGIEDIEDITAPIDVTVEQEEAAEQGHEVESDLYEAIDNMDKRKYETHQADTVGDLHGESMILLMLHDKGVPGMLTYFRDTGIKVSRIYNDVSEIKNGLLLLECKARIVVVDSGTGKMTGTTSRGQLLDFLGICDSDIQITMFYTDSSVRVEFEKELGKLKKTVKFIKFVNTIGIVAELLQYKENYVYTDRPQQESLESNKILSSYRGYKDSGAVEGDRLPFKSFSTASIIENICSSDKDVLPSYKVNLN